MESGIGVVIIDDSSQWRRRLESAVVEIAGLTVIGSAGTPSAAIDLAAGLRPPIMILDMSLAGGSGMDVLRAVGNLGTHTRVVVLTGFPSARLRALCLALGARYFLDKAFEFEKLEGALRDLLREIGTIHPN